MSYTNTTDGMEKLDGICMLLIAVGESLKNIDKITGKTLLPRYPEIDWKGAKGMRDIISHHYFDIDAEEIFWVCENNLPPLAETMEKIIADVTSGQNTWWRLIISKGYTPEDTLWGRPATCNSLENELVTYWWTSPFLTLDDLGGGT